MASEIRVNKIENRSGLGTVTFADTGVDLAGIVTATTFSGSGASLTALPAAQLSGTLPAISGANLTNLAAANLTGTIADARFPATLPAVSAANLTNVPAANITGTLPALSAASLTSIPAANIVGLATAGFERSGGFPQGITMANRWHLTGNFNLSSAGTYYTITGTWQESTAAGYNSGKLGSSMTESSGVFTFPSTGIYYIVYDCLTGTSNDQLNMWSYITVGSDNTSTNYMSVMASSGDSATMNTVTHSALLDVTNTSTQKVFVRGYAASTGCYVSGNSDGNRTRVTFIRLGDT